jgi:hypothetical protein
MLLTPNLPRWERIGRLIAGLAIIAASLMVLESVYRWIGVASGVGIALTALTGFCPACAMVGRRL